MAQDARSRLGLPFGMNANIPTVRPKIAIVGVGGYVFPPHRVLDARERVLAVVPDESRAGGRVPAEPVGCVWGLPGSTWWSRERAAEEIARRNDGGSVDVSGAVPITMPPGDVLVHDVLVLHGSQPTSGPLRRVVYYEFRPVPLEVEHEPHTVEYVARKQQVLAAALRARARVPDAAGEPPFVYGGAPVDGDGADWATDPPTWRYAHEDHWRTPWLVATPSSPSS